MDKCQGKAYVHASSEVSTIVSQQKGANQANQIGKAKGSIVSTTVYAVHPYAIVHRFFFFEGMFIFLVFLGVLKLPLIRNKVQITNAIRRIEEPHMPP